MPVCAARAWVWAIASIHGEARRLSRLHDAISARFQTGDRIVYLGNYLGHGEAIAATLDELLDFRCRILATPHGFACDVVFLRGAQEEIWQKLLQLQFAANPGQILEWMVRAGVESTVKAYGGELRHGFAAARDGPRTITRWTTSLRGAMNAALATRPCLYYRYAAFTTDNAMLFVHAAVDPRRPLAAQTDAFWWGGHDILTLTGGFGGFRRVVRGFDRERHGLVESDFAVSIDAGCGRGGPLLAVCFDGTGEGGDRAEG